MLPNQAQYFCVSDQKSIAIFKKKVTVATIKRKGLPEVIPQAGLTIERKKYLYVEIRPFVSPEYQDILAHLHENFLKYLKYFKTRFPN